MPIIEKPVAPGLTSTEAKRGSADTADLTALLGAFCFFLSAVEYMLPKPLPFLRLGIANLPIVLAVSILPARWFFVLALVKVIGMSLVSGSLFSFVALFSLAGTMAAALVMRAAWRLGGSGISAIGVSVLGATASNAAQVVLATAFVFGEAARLIAPVFLGMGLITGLLLGLFVEGFSRSSSWLAMATGRPLPRESEPSGRPDTASGDAPFMATDRKPGVPAGIEPALAPIAGLAAIRRAERAARRTERLAARAAAKNSRGRRRRRFESMFDPAFLAAAGMAISVAYLFQRDLGTRAIMCAAFLTLSLLAGRGFSPLATLLTMVGIVAANLVVPTGRVIATLGPLSITSGALADGFGKALVFEGLIFISRTTILPTLKLPGRLGSVVARAFKYYDRILEHKAELRPATLLRDVDALVLRVWKGSREARADGMPEDAVRSASTASRWGAVLLVLAVAAAYAPLVIV